MLAPRTNRRPVWRLDFFRLEDRNAPSESLSYLLGAGFLPEPPAGTPPPAVSTAADGDFDPVALTQWLPPDEPGYASPDNAETGVTPPAPSEPATGGSNDDPDWLEKAAIRVGSPYVGVSEAPPAPPSGGSGGDSSGGSVAPPAPAAPTTSASGSTAPTGGGSAPAVSSTSTTSESGGTGDADPASGSTEEATTPEEPAGDSAASGLEVSISGVNTYAIDRKGYTPERWKEIVSSSDPTVNPFTVAVDLTITVTNTSDAPVSLFAGPSMSYLDLELTGPGVVTTPVFTSGFGDFSSRVLTFQPGESQSVAVTRLGDVRSEPPGPDANGVYQYWTEAGEYQLVATLRSEAFAEPPESWPIPNVFPGDAASESVEVSSDPFAITVTDPGPGAPPYICGLPAPEPVPEATTDKLAVTLSGTSTYELDRGWQPGGWLEAAYREYPETWTRCIPLSPQVDLTVSVTNTDDEPVTLLTGGMPVWVELQLTGEGAVTFEQPSFWFCGSIPQYGITLAPGESHQIPVSYLAWSGAGMSGTSFWTRPGEYELSATLHTAIGSELPELGMGNVVPDGFERVAVTSEPFAITVTPPVRQATAADLQIGIRGTNTYALDPNRVPENNEPAADPTAGNFWVYNGFPPPPPEVDLTVTITNTADEPVAISPYDQPFQLALHGAGAVERSSMVCVCYGYAPDRVLQPGESAEFRVTGLANGWQSFLYWTQPGEYELVATHWTATGEVASEPFAITVTEPDRQYDRCPPEMGVVTVATATDDPADPCEPIVCG